MSCSECHVWDVSGFSKLNVGRYVVPINDGFDHNVKAGTLVGSVCFLLIVRAQNWEFFWGSTGYLVT